MLKHADTHLTVLAEFKSIYLIKEYKENNKSTRNDVHDVMNLFNHHH